MFSKTSIIFLTGKHIISIEVSYQRRANIFVPVTCLSDFNSVSEKSKPYFHLPLFQIISNLQYWSDFRRPFAVSDCCCEYEWVEGQIGVVYPPRQGSSRGNPNDARFRRQEVYRHEIDDRTMENQAAIEWALFSFDWRKSWSSFKTFGRSVFKVFKMIFSLKKVKFDSRQKRALKSLGNYGNDQKLPMMLVNDKRVIFGATEISRFVALNFSKRYRILEILMANFRPLRRFELRAGRNQQSHRRPGEN